MKGLRKRMNTKEELFETIQQLREKKYSDIPSELVQKLLEIEAESVEDRSEVLRKIEILVEKYLNN